MNQLFTNLSSNLSQAKSNPHVFWPLAIFVGLRIGLHILFGAMDIYAPSLKGQNAAMQDMLEPYMKDAFAALTSYATLAAANSGPADPPSSPPPNPPPTTT